MNKASGNQLLGEMIALLRLEDWAKDLDVPSQGAGHRGLNLPEQEADNRGLELTSPDIKEQSQEELEGIWRGLINQRPALPLQEDYLLLEDTYLRDWHDHHDVGLEACQPTEHPNILFFAGDLATLQVDGLVNAANSDLLGCFIPNHGCLDNALHTYAGARLRVHCGQLMALQGKKEPVGRVKVTPAFHLPAQRLLHTVGPYVPQGQKPSRIRARLLAQSYQACLDMASQLGLKTLALPALSTGEFGFPKEEAAEIALSTSLKFLSMEGRELQLIFSLYQAEDWGIYERILNKLLKEGGEP